MTSNLKAVQNSQHSSPISWFWVREIVHRSQGGTDLERPGAVALGISRVTGADAVPSGIGCTPYIRRAMLLWAAEVRAAASGHKRPRNADLVFTRLGNEVSIFSNNANLSPQVRDTSAEGRLCQSIELDLNGAGKSRSSPEPADRPADAKAFA